MATGSSRPLHNSLQQAALQMLVYAQVRVKDAIAKCFFSQHGIWGRVDWRIGMLTFMLRYDVTLIMGVGVGWGGMLTFSLRWWCYADHGGWVGWGWNLTFRLRWWFDADKCTFWLSGSDGTQGRTCWKQLPVSGKFHCRKWSNLTAASDGWAVPWTDDHALVAFRQLNENRRNSRDWHFPWVTTC